MAVAAIVPAIVSGLVKAGISMLAKWFLPDKKHDEILRCFRQLSSEIGQVTAQIRDLEKLIKWELTGLQYAEVIQRIKLGMEYCLGIGKGITKAEIDYQNRLKELCSNQSITLALDALLEGMAGEGLFRKSILDNLYDQTKGDRRKIVALTNRLEQLICGGLIVLATYETLVRGAEGAKEMARRYGSRLKAVSAKVESIIGRCQDNFRDNMLNDLNTFLDTGRPNKDLVTEVSNFMTNKYDWLENFCLIYNDLQGFDKHCFNGQRVESLHRKGKCGIVFYRMKGEPPRFSNRYDEAYKINNDVSCGNAQQGYNSIVAKLGEKGIGWIGVVVIRRGPDLWFVGTFSTRNATIVGSNATAIILLQ